MKGLVNRFIGGKGILNNNVNFIVVPIPIHAIDVKLEGDNLFFNCKQNTKFKIPKIILNSIYNYEITLDYSSKTEDSDLIKFYKKYFIDWQSYKEYKYKIENKKDLIIPAVPEIKFLKSFFWFNKIWLRRDFSIACHSTELLMSRYLFIKEEKNENLDKI